jgi:hypothetical protein
MQPRTLLRIRVFKSATTVYTRSSFATLPKLHPEVIAPEFTPRTEIERFLTKLPAVEMDNTGNKPIRVPGFGGMPVDFEEDSDDRKRFAHGANDWDQSPRLTARELSMLALMNALSDKPDWEKKVFDEDIAEKWHQEALTMPLISESAWKWCLSELKDKARNFEKSGYVPAFDSGSGCIKSDALVGDELRQELVRAVQPLQNVPAEEKDWHPRSKDQVLNLVHPSLFPLVYGSTRVLVQGGQVELNNVFDSYGKSEVTQLQRFVYADSRAERRRFGYNREQVEQHIFSPKFQWLPCEVEFQGDEGNDVRITSYINNLHPLQHKSLYNVIEKLIGLSIDPWNKVLVYKEENRTPVRIRTYGYDWEPSLPDWAPEVGWRTYLRRKELGEEKFNELLVKVREYMKLPDSPGYESDPDQDDEDEIVGNEKRKDGTWEEEEDLDLSPIIEWKWKRLRSTKHPEPGAAFSYEDWKAGNVGNAVVESPEWSHPNPESRKHEYYDVNLASEYRSKGLQVIVKLSSIELTPDNPEYEGGSWHIEGMLNEHIVATSIYYYDVQNTTESRIRFRQEAELDDMAMNYEQDEHEPLCEIFGTDSLRDEVAIQELGSITTPQGRLIAFPNTLQHCVEPFKLADPTRPGHRRFIVMWLVDPHYRICSTRNVPPQQHDWWAPEGYHQVGIDEKLPAELADMVKGEVGEWPMGKEEAKKLRLELMDERTSLMEVVEGRYHEYNFCEH